MSSISSSSGTVTRSAKPLPDGYICNACGSDSHSIHDCPSKTKSKKSVVSVSNELDDTQKAKISKPPKPIKIRKIYISGLPYDTTKVSLKELLEKVEDKPCLVSYIQLVCFEDNLSKCNGQAFVTCKDEQSVNNALLLNGQQIGTKILKVQKVRVDTTAQAIPSSTEGSGQKRCFRCGMNHDPNTCNNPRICYRCKATDHISPHCPLKKTNV